ncbi:MAG: hypothetical protein H0V33_09535 [Acidimicrobiia bacterium]|nr:hypothetical protein [Acidimicrobiia bacterium]
MAQSGEPLHDRIECRAFGDVEDEQVVGRGWGARAARHMRGELEVVVIVRNGEEYAAVPVVVVEPSDDAQAEALGIEAHDLVEAVGGASDANLSDRKGRRPTHTPQYGDEGRA